MRQNVITFRDFTFPFNPSELRLQSERAVQKIYLPLCGETVRDLGAGAQKITGSGSFSGDDAAENYINLQNEYLRGGEGMLLLPGFCPMNAVFSSLKASAASGEIGYEFSFVQENASMPDDEKDGFYTIKSGESLWDASAKLNIPMNALAACNPQYASPFAVSEGERVKLP